MRQLLLFCVSTIFVISCTNSEKPVTKQERIKSENLLPGTSDWLINVNYDTCSLPDHRFCRRPQVEGYCSQTSVSTGDTIDFFVSTNPVSNYALEIYRMGYYQGKGGNLKKKVDSLSGKAQTTPEPDPKTNFFECKWDTSYSLVIPPDWTSGVYLCKLTTLPDHFQSYMIFIVKDKRKADFIFQCSDLTWQAYNRWPRWNSMYDEGHVPWVNTNGAKVSFDRPYAIYINELPSAFNPLSNGSGEFLMWEYPLCYWMEKEGYDVTYISNMDTHADSTELLRSKAFLSVGHDEYWTYNMFNNVRNARDKGVNLLFLSGNSVDGIEYLESSTDGRPNRSTGRMPEREFTNEQELMGASSWGVGYASFVCQAPDHWLFAHTGMKKGDSIPQLVGWEYHGRPAGHQPDLTVVAESKVDPLNFGQGPENHIATIYTAAKGNYVFNAGTCFWVQPLAKTPAYQHPMEMRKPIDFSHPDARVQQITKNLLERAIEK
ncbi:MAG TPA: N,N-dimethylformamidase beta subunit family domain-containing protein [Chryseolinea sp.]|nr:N,N-dimethylformamidase beta subunit family domain-containing protein [Chryseolinea sp.]